MRKVLFVFLAAVVLSLGCAITDYPVITDAHGGDAGTMQSFYDKAYIIPSGQVATIWFDGSDELYTQVTQDWKGDQWLYTYDNFDPSGAINFLGQTYCDPVRQTNQPLATAWNPDIPGDDVFDYVADPTAPGWRSLSVLVSYGSRYMGECGSGVWADKQGLAYEFSMLDKVNFRGTEYYYAPMGADVASVALTDANGAITEMPFFGRYNIYIDKQLRLAIPMTPNMAHMVRWLKAYTQEHGSQVDLQLVYGNLTANYQLNVVGLDNIASRF